MLKGVEGLLIDLDGTIFKGEELIPGADEAIFYLRSLHKQIVFVSNRGNISRKMCCERLQQLGVQVEKEEILLSCTVAARFLKEHYPDCQVWTLGDQGLREELEEEGIHIAAVPENADFLVITLHETLTYHDLNQAFQAVQHGARIIATNADKTFPNEKGNSIDVAGMIGAIEAASGRRTELIFGKPSCFMAEAALRQLNIDPEKCMMIGDSIESDILMGHAHGMKTMLVLSGNTRRKQLESLLGTSKPNYIVDSIYNITQLN